jgi:hypothetical protein
MLFIYWHFCVGSFFSLSCCAEAIFYEDCFFFSDAFLVGITKARTKEQPTTRTCASPQIKVFGALFRSPSPDRGFDFASSKKEQEV